MSDWYYEQNGNAVGPIEESVMLEWIRYGQLFRSQRIRPEGSTTWKPAGEYPQLWNRDEASAVPIAPYATQATSGVPALAGALTVGELNAAPVLGYESRHPMTRMVADYFLRMCVCKMDTPFYGTMDAGATPIGMLRAGDLFSLGEAQRLKGVKRTAGVLLDGRAVYVPAEAIIFKIRRAKLTAGTKVHLDRSRYSAVLDTLPANSEIILVDEVASAEGDTMLEIRDPQARRGYMARRTGVSDLTARANSASKEMLVGGAVCVLGLVITIGTYTAASSSPGGGTYVIAWGPAIFGAIQFFKGLSRLGEAAPPATLLELNINQIIEEKLVSRDDDLARPTAPEMPEAQRKVIDDPLIWPHWFLILVMPYVTIIWGIINLLRGKKRSGKLLFIGSIVWVVIVFVMIQTLKG